MAHKGLMVRVCNSDLETVPVTWCPSTQYAAVVYSYGGILGSYSQVIRGDGINSHSSNRAAHVQQNILKVSSFMLQFLA